MDFEGFTTTIAFIAWWIFTLSEHYAHRDKRINNLNC